MSGTEKATWKIILSLTGVVFAGSIWYMGTYLIFLSDDYDPDKRDLIGYPLVTFMLMAMVAFAVRSVLRLVFEMRNEYCFDCDCDCDLDEDESESEVNHDTFEDDPGNPGVKMYPAVP